MKCASTAKTPLRWGLSHGRQHCPGAEDVAVNRGATRRAGRRPPLSSVRWTTRRPAAQAGSGHRAEPQRHSGRLTFPAGGSPQGVYLLPYHPSRERGTRRSGCLPAPTEAAGSCHLARHRQHLAHGRPSPARGAGGLDDPHPRPGWVPSSPSPVLKPWRLRP